MKTNSKKSFSFAANGCIFSKCFFYLDHHLVLHTLLARFLFLMCFRKALLQVLPTFVSCSSKPFLAWPTVVFLQLNLLDFCVFRGVFVVCVFCLVGLLFFFHFGHDLNVL